MGLEYLLVVWIYTHNSSKILTFEMNDLETCNAGKIKAEETYSKFDTVAMSGVVTSCVAYDPATSTS